MTKHLPTLPEIRQQLRRAFRHLSPSAIDGKARAVAQRMAEKTTFTLADDWALLTGGFVWITDEETASRRKREASEYDAFLKDHMSAADYAATKARKEGR